MNVLALTISMLFSFDYSFMMEQRGYFSSDSGNYWSLVRNKYGDKNGFYISECVQGNDTLWCWEYSVDCGDGIISRKWEDNEIYIGGKNKDYWDIEKNILLSYPKTIETNIVVEEKVKYVFKTIQIHSTNYDMTCLFINDLGPRTGFLFGERGCNYSNKVIEPRTYEANLCKEGIE